MRFKLGFAAGLGLMASIVAANYLTTRYGFIPVGFGLMATAGTLAAGFALALRDGLQDTWGRLATVGVIIVGAALSYLVSDPAIALASAMAFLLAELIDLAVYTPIRSRARFGDWLWGSAVIASGVVGAVVDTVIFLWIAFGLGAVMPALAGQLLGKLWAALAYIALGKLGQAGRQCAHS